MDNFYSAKLEQKLENVRVNILPNIKIWPLNFSSLVRTFFNLII